jgi:nitrile hydratase
MHGFGAVQVESDEPVFHSEWERRIFGVQICTRSRGINNLDEVRHGLESMDPLDYLAASYYEKWIVMLERLLVQKGVVTEEELVERRRKLEAEPDAPLPSFEDEPFRERLARIVRGGGRANVEVAAPPRFRVGGRVVTRNAHPRGHTRLTRYARGRSGVVERVYEAFPLPDANARGVEQPEYVYAIRFDGSELWGESAEPNSTNVIDLFESYLIPAEDRRRR